MNELGKIVDVFRCCILTWDFLPVVLPAFLIAGAIPVFVPYTEVMRFLGYGASRVKSYAVACVSGFLVSMCSCNVVPVADSIHRQGAGIGPTVAFLFAGPAINLVTLVWVFQVVGLKMGLWRGLAVPICAVLSGIAMEAAFRRKVGAGAHNASPERAARASAASHAAAGGPRLRHVVILFGLLLAILLFGAPGVPWPVRLPTLAILGGTLVAVLPRWFDADDLGEWIHQTGVFLKRVLPILIPVIIVIGLIQNYAFIYVIRWLRPLLGANTARASYTAAALGSLLYFPMLTEVALVKVLLKDNIVAVGPGLALLINGPGVSLPGAILLVRVFGWKRTLLYEALEIFLGGTIGFLFGNLYGDYVCPCQAAAPGTIMEDPTSLYAAAILGICLCIAWARFSAAGRSRNAAAPT